MGIIRRQTVKLLEQIDSPEDLKQLTRDELKQLAGELRETIVGVISHSGGHLLL